MDSKFKKQWSIAAVGIGAAIVGAALIFNDPVPEQEEPPRDNDTTEVKPPADDPSVESDQAMNAADKCIADAVKNRLIPVYENMAEEFRTAIKSGLTVDLQHQANKLEIVTARQFVQCEAQTGMESTEASDAAREKMETTKQNFISEFAPQNN